MRAYRDVTFEPNMVMVVDVREIKSKGGEFSMVEYGWSVLPIFYEEGYVRSGVYQLPLLQGSPTKEFLDTMQFESPWSVIGKELEKGKKSAIKFKGRLRPRA